LKEILELENFQAVLNLSKNGENYRQIITDTISQLEKKIKGHQEEAESPLNEEDLGHESIEEERREDFIFKTNDDFFLGVNYAFKSLEMEIVKEGGRVNENGQIELP